MSPSHITPRRLRSTVAVAGLGLMIGLVGPVAGMPAPATAATCGITWGSLAKSTSPMTTSALRGVRTGQHACYDRIVFDIGPGGHGRVGYDVRYATVYSDGSGAVVPLRGAADIRIVIKAPAYDVRTGRATYTPANPRELSNVAGFSTFRQVAWAGSFEGQTTIGLGVRARLPMRVLVLTDTSGSQRLVVDVAHRW